MNKPTDIIKEIEKEELYTIKENDIEIKFKDDIINIVKIILNF